MDSIASSVTKAITDLLEQNEKRFVGQQVAQEAQGKVLETLLAKVDSLEAKCNQLSGENNSLREELKKSKKRENDSIKEVAKETVQIKSDIEKIHGRLDEFNGWVKLITTLAEQVSGLNDDRDNMGDKMKEVLQNQADIAKFVRRLEQKYVANTIRTPVKSPSTASFLNGNNYSSDYKSGELESASLRSYPRNSSMPRMKPSSRFYKNNQFFESLDPSDQMSEIGADAEMLKQGVDALNDLQRSFEKSSFYSDD